MPLNRYWDAAGWQHVTLTQLRPGDTLRVAGVTHTIREGVDGTLVAVAADGRTRWLGRPEPAVARPIRPPLLARMTALVRRISVTHGRL